MTESDDARGTRVPMASSAIVSFELILRCAPARRAAIEEQARRLLSGTLAHDEALVDRSADPADVDRVSAFLTNAGLIVDSVDLEKRSILASGNAAAVAKLLAVAFSRRTEEGTSWREYTGEARVPTELGGLVVSILGLSTKPIASRSG